MLAPCGVRNIGACEEIESAGPFLSMRVERINLDVRKVLSVLSVRI